MKWCSKQDLPVPASPEKKNRRNESVNAVDVQVHLPTNYDKFEKKVCKLDAR